MAAERPHATANVTAEAKWCFLCEDKTVSICARQMRDMVMRYECDPHVMVDRVHTLFQKYKLEFNLDKDWSKEQILMHFTQHEKYTNFIRALHTKEMMEMFESATLSGNTELARSVFNRMQADHQRIVAKYYAKWTAIHDVNPETFGVASDPVTALQSDVEKLSIKK
jgi:hypothetical protein